MVDGSSPNEGARFFAFFAGGIVAIVVLKVLPLGLISLWVPTTCACLLMCWYARELRDPQAKRARFESAGDYIYYLGFLYTLCSVAVSLVQIGLRLNDRSPVDALVRDVVSGFGIAVATTILGMAFRVWLGRAEADDPDTVEAETRTQLATAARTLRVELEYTLEQQQKFRERLEEEFEALVSGFRGFRVDAGKQLEAALAEMGGVVGDEQKMRERLASEFEELFVAAGRFRSAVGGGTAEAAQAFGKFHDVLAGSLGELVSKFGRFHRDASASLDAVAKRLDGFGVRVGDTLDRTSTGFGEVERRFREGLDETVREASERAAPLVQVVEKISGSAESVRRCSEEVVRNAEAFAGFMERVGANVDGSGGVGATADELVREMTRLREAASVMRRTADAMEQSAARAGKAAGAFDDLCRSFVETSGAIKGETERLTAAAARLEGLAPSARRWWRFWVWRR